MQKCYLLLQKFRLGVKSIFEKQRGGFMTQQVPIPHSIHTNWGNAVCLYGGGHFIYNGRLWELPGNITDGPPEMQNLFIRSLKMARDEFPAMTLPPEKLREFWDNKTKEILKNCPPNSFVEKIYAVVHATTMLVVVIISCKVAARL